MFLGYLELFHPEIHGMDASSHPNICEHYISVLSVSNPAKYLEFQNSLIHMTREAYDYANAELLEYKTFLFHVKNQSKRMPITHPLIKNFPFIQNRLYLPETPHIYEKIYLESGECVCILKTVWIKCIQRKWKKICLHNSKLLEEMKTIKYLHTREVQQNAKHLIGLSGLWYSTL